MTAAVQLDIVDAAEEANRPRLLDLYCCQGGAAAGYGQAGFLVTGVDTDDTHRERYLAGGGDAFHLADAVGFVYAHLDWIRREFAAVHASPPCQFATKAQRIQGREHPNLIPPTREALRLLGLPYVIENVEEARGHLEDPVVLCGAQFGLRTYRHRMFEAGGGFELGHPPHPRHEAPTVKMGRPLADGDWYHAVGNFSNVPYVRADMAMPWASRDGLREAVPPAYTHWIGERLLAALPALDTARSTT